MSLEKENFLRTRFIVCLQQLDPNTAAQWGKMNVHQMIEHLTDVMMVASGKIKMEVVTPADKLPLFKAFMMSDKPFKENTKSPVLPEEPLPLRKQTVQAAIGKLQEELIYFFNAFESNPQFKTTHPVFGDLDFTENIQLLHKHILHHLKQFGISPLVAG
ncbi:MAG TPA: hypothetical protein PK275_04675 [Chitinophagaceae bacterium]|nr:hypothetical protein [Chitinophagaceae bacterium]